MRNLFFALICLWFLVVNGVAAPMTKPNVLLILADDLGWSDLGSYGGEISTPNLNNLAKNGLRFTQFYNSARCCPTRASLLTGLHPHQAGFPEMNGVLPDHAVTLPEVLKPAGYKTYMVGKWHLGNERKPTDRGFDEFYGMLGGFNSFWQEDPYYTRWPQGRAKRPYAKDEFYATDAFGDYATDFIKDGHKTGQPWFMYLAFNAPHFPLHAPENVVAKYEKMYLEKGWDAIRSERLTRQKKLKLLPEDMPLTPRSEIPANRFNKQTGWADKENPAWDNLPADRRADLARRMAVYAAMVEIMDTSIGRVMEHLKKTNALDNTLIFFLSDNGACAEWDPWGFDKLDSTLNILHKGDDLKNIGGPNSYISYGSGWANASNTPWRLYKHYNHEGGIRTPMIVHWPQGLKTKPFALTQQPGYITDFMPTLLELCGASYPQVRNGHKITPHEGVSLAPVLQNQKMPPRILAVEHEGNRMVREGNWKLVALHDKPWELYNLASDSIEMNDLSAREPARVQKMSAAWNEWAERVGAVKKPKAKVEISSPQIANKALVIRCDVTTQARNGVILAQGGRQHGYALHLKEGKPVFSVRQNEKLFAIASSEVVGGKFSIEARLAKDGSMNLSINNKIVAQDKAPGLIGVQPLDELSIGQDGQTAVGDYIAPYPLKGKVENVKVTAE
jgi:arylsulfatase